MKIYKEKSIDENEYLPTKEMFIWRVSIEILIRHT